MNAANEAHAANANTYRHDLGTPDYSLSAELEDYAAEQEAELRERASADRWEAQGRAEMYETLRGDGWGY